MDDLGAVPCGGFEPELDDRGAVSHRVVADDDDDLGLGDRRQWQTERVERDRGRLGQHGRVGSEAAAEEPREPVRLLERLRSRESGDDPALGAAEQRLDAIERVIPSDRLEAEPATGERLGDAIGGLQVG